MFAGSWSPIQIRRSELYFPLVDVNTNRPKYYPPPPNQVESDPLRELTVRHLLVLVQPE